MTTDIQDDAKTRMQKAIDSLVSEFSKLRTGRAHPSVLDHIMVSYYGSDTPLNQVANITVEDARTLKISPWEKNLLQDVEKAIIASDLGLNPVTQSDSVRVPMPAMTEERRKELVKVLKTEAENTRIAIRNIRRDANSAVNKLLKDKEISEDDDRRSQDQIQKITDTFVKKVDELMAAKEKDVMEI